MMQLHLQGQGSHMLSFTFLGAGLLARLELRIRPMECANESRLLMSDLRCLTGIVPTFVLRC